MGSNESVQKQRGNPPGKPQQKGKEKKSKAAVTNSCVLAWGEGESGQLGISQTMTACPTPTQVPFFSQVKVKSISCGPSHAAYLTPSGVVFMVGSGASYRLGVGHDKPCFTPTINAFSEENPVTQVACGGTFTIFLTNRGLIYSCGTSKKGAIGQGESVASRVPKRVNRISKVTKIACGIDHAAAINEYGKLFTWGDPTEGALGHGELDYSMKLQGRQGLPKQVESSYVSRTKFIDVACGDYHTAILSEAGDVSCCGRGKDGQLGYGGKQEHFFPRKIDVESEPEEEDEKGKRIQGIRIYCGASSTAIISVTGEIYFWGDGQIYPSLIKTPEKAVHVALHPSNGMILSENNKVFSYDIEELNVADVLSAVPVKWQAPSISYISTGPKYFTAIIGEEIPDLAGERQLVLSSAGVKKKKQEDSSLRDQLFSGHEKNTDRVLDSDKASSNTQLFKKKQELFSVAPKKTESQQSNKEERNALMSNTKRETKKEKPIEFDDADDLDSFKKQLLGANADAFPDAPKSSEDNITRNELFATSKKQPEISPDEERNELFSVPKKSQKVPEIIPSIPDPAESDEEFIDELPDNCTLYDKPSMRPNYLDESDLPEPETLNGVDLLDDDDLL